MLLKNGHACEILEPPSNVRVGLLEISPESEPVEGEESREEEEVNDGDFIADKVGFSLKLVIDDPGNSEELVFGSLDILGRQLEVAVDRVDELGSEILDFAVVEVAPLINKRIFIVGASEKRRCASYSGNVSQNGGSLPDALSCNLDGGNLAERVESEELGSLEVVPRGHGVNRRFKVNEVAEGLNSSDASVKLSPAPNMNDRSEHRWTEGFVAEVSATEVLEEGLRLSQQHEPLESVRELFLESLPEAETEQRRVQGGEHDVSHRDVLADQEG